MRRFVAALLGVAATVALLATPVRAAGIPGLKELHTHARPAGGHTASAHTGPGHTESGRPGSGPVTSGRPHCLLNVLGLLCLL
ncbi:hypothetical protein ACSNOK_13905 [Streptomyces sp. URMC 126]|uniref:hypothetical protein n=1 Tax=Streptomyces sp. URMC 126 TaxID=3423401 RepID=UPI003F19BA9B